MNMKSNLLLLAIASLFCTTLSAQTELTKYRPGVTPEGTVYFLPKTGIKVKVLVEKSTTTPGDFCNYAERYLRQSGVPQEVVTNYQVIDIQQIPFAMIDSTKAFAIKFSPKTVAPNVALSDDGRLLAINATPHAQAEEPAPFTPAPKPRKVNPRQYMTQEMISAGSTAKMAELVAAEIYDLRENRSLLIKGQADFMPKESAQMQLMLSQLDNTEKALARLFVGTTERDTTEYEFCVEPAATPEKQVLFRLSQKLGIVDADDLSGTPYYISVENLNTVLVPDGETITPKKKKEAPESGVYVNVPGKMRSTIYKGINPIKAVDMPAPQFGNVELLSGQLFDKRYTTHLWLNALTGSVERLEAEQPKK